ncbi:subtilisin-like protease SBT1.7 [Sorghum bicolor]|uniref:subtilisin-like protease SBT1.7 n=1 Tax=Sorghum bicolor TaxID=4558 RepID=UPI00081ACC58|nr:subtilisin-like protease SBT1.7 [Sorghum bicolor]|eukprot:XP_021306681.1 subtilisin-like protease SBT1.7 [Sorghum bicolor]
MRSIGMLRPLLLALAVAAAATTAVAVAADKRKTYIVHMAKSAMPAEYADDHAEWYGASLRSVSTSTPAAKMLYAYDTVLHGFSARLTPQEASDLASADGVLAVNPEARYELHTTRTPEFLGIAGGQEGLFPQSGTAADVVVGVLDTGAWPESKSYDDAGLPEVPSWWKGACESGASGFDAASACNRKLVGARFFSKGYEAAMGPMDTDRESRSPRDDDGHGTHTSSTAAGAAVPGASLFGFAAGTARGMAPRARVAVYKVCWLGGCFSSDILAGMDAAVADGCGVLSLSLGGGAADYSRDSVAIGAFAATEQNVLVSCSAGNAGPGSSTLSNVAPWITTVGAGTLDRDFPAYVVLGDGKNYTGVSLYSGNKPLPSAPIPIVYAANASNSTAGNLCMPGTLTPEKVAGKIVLCDRGVSARVQKGLVVRDAGGAGMVLSNTAANGQELVADAHLLPAAGVGEREGTAIKSYVASDPNPTATIVVAGTQVGVRPSPVVAAFSSRGPNMVTPEILKPDMIAPGVNILAAWTGKAGPTGLEADTRRVGFNIISGTSMSCPHVSGLAALLRSAHPEWSPAAVRSALMTTAYASYSGGGSSSPLLDAATGAAATPFDYGAGHVDPARAVDPGLVYDLGTRDYVDFLCALKYSSTMIAAVARSGQYACAENKTYSVGSLNYPSFSVAYSTANGDGGGDSTTTVTHTRTLTSVGGAGTYKVSTALAAAKGVAVDVEPAELEFTKVGEKKSYTVKFTSKSQPSGTTGFGRLVWSDGKHSVASPIAFTWT